MKSRLLMCIVLVATLVAGVPANAVDHERAA